MEQSSNLNNVMESRDHFKNGASLKSQMNKGKQINQLLYICAFLICTLCSSCGKEEDTGTGTSTTREEAPSPVVAKVKFVNKYTTNNTGFWVVDINATESYSSAGKIVRYVFKFGGTSSLTNLPGNPEVHDQTVATSYQPYMGIWGVYNSPNLFYFHAMVEVYDEKGNKGESEWIVTTKP
ncbi:MAG: hypothetical protein FWD60_06750 [Candidatus Azobacteroides sp.]|nr:hypothetical protein [Candidatus Azobacteroides sp.]